MTLFVVAKVDASRRYAPFSVANCVVGRNEKNKGHWQCQRPFELNQLQPKMLRRK